MSDYSPLKCGVIWAGIFAVVVAIFVPMVFMVNHYNDTETKRANACTAERGTYSDGRCSWSGQ